MSQLDIIAEEELRRWHQWLECDGKLLRNLPLPKSVLIDRPHWDDFVYEGGDKFPLDDFPVTSLTLAEAELLLSFLESYIPDEQKLHSWLYRDLRERCGKVPVER